MTNGSKPSTMTAARRWTRRLATSSRYHIRREGAQGVVHHKAGVGRGNHSVPHFTHVHLGPRTHLCQGFRHWVQYHTWPRAEALQAGPRLQIRSACTSRQWSRSANVLKCVIAGAGLFSSVNLMTHEGRDIGLGMQLDVKSMCSSYQVCSTRYTNVDAACYQTLLAGPPRQVVQPPRFVPVTP